MHIMKMRLAFVVACFIAACASAQSRPALRPRRQSTQLVAQWVDLEGNKKEDEKPCQLEPLLPFAEAVEKAKAGDAQGYYALAIHYAKGDEIDRDAEKARKFLQKASDMGYSNAVFVATMLAEASTDRRPNSLILRSVGDRPQVHAYTGTGLLGFSHQAMLTLTNETDVATIRAGYERAINLGVAVATNELARFERRVSAAQDEAKKQADASDKKRRNAGLVNSILQNEFQEEHRKKSELRKRLNDPDADDDEGRTFTWTAGGEEGLSFDVFIRAKEEQGWHYLEKATITIDKDGRIIKIEGRQGRTEIQS